MAKQIDEEAMAAVSENMTRFSQLSSEASVLVASEIQLTLMVGVIRGIKGDAFVKAFLEEVMADKTMTIKLNRAVTIQ